MSITRFVLSRPLSLLTVAFITSLGAESVLAQNAVDCADVPESPTHHYLAANADTVHWGYFSKDLAPQVVVHSGDTVTIETLTHHANDDKSLMVTGDAGAESVFRWEKGSKGVDRRGAGPMDASVLGRGPGEGFGVHVLTGPVYVCGAEPGDILEVKILDMTPCPSASPEHHGKTFGSNAAAWWGYHYNDLIEEPKPREVITIYQVDATEEHYWATAVYNYRWVPQTDPDGLLHEVIAYPGYFGGNIDNWRIGKGGTIYYPVAVEGALLSATEIYR